MILFFLINARLQAPCIPIFINLSKVIPAPFKCCCWFSVSSYLFSHSSLTPIFPMLHFFHTLSKKMCKFPQRHRYNTHTICMLAYTYTFLCAVAPMLDCYFLCLSFMCVKYQVNKVKWKRNGAFFGIPLKFVDVCLLLQDNHKCQIKFQSEESQAWNAHSSHTSHC